MSMSGPMSARSSSSPWSQHSMATRPPKMSTSVAAASHASCSSPRATSRGTQPRAQPVSANNPPACCASTSSGTAGLPARTFHAGFGDEHRQIPIAFPILREQYQVSLQRRRIVHRASCIGVAVTMLDARCTMHFDCEFGSDDAVDLRFARRLRERDDAAELVVIGERERAVAERLRARHERLGRRRTIQQRERGMAVEFDVLAQSYHPCTNHFPLSAYTSSSPRAEAPRQ